MTEVTFDAPAETELPPVQVEQAPAQPAPGSILGRLRAEREEMRGGRTKVLYVGPSRTIAARYRPLSDDEQVPLAKRTEKVEAELRRLQDQPERKLQAAIDLTALTLATACVELLAVTADGVVPLVDGLKAEGIDTQGDEPMRYDRRTASVLGYELGDRPSGPEVVAAMHEADGAHDALFSAAEAFGKWVARDDHADLERLLEGN